MNAVSDYTRYVPRAVAGLENPQTDIPRIAKDGRLLKQIEAAVRQIPTTHQVIQGDARELTFLEDELIHVVVTSPPYWTLKKYKNHVNQLGSIENYETFLCELDKVWAHCHRVLVPGGRLICVVSDVCVSRRKNDGRHTVVPLHASIQNHCREIGYDNLTPIIWHKIANAAFEASGQRSRFFGETV